MGFSGPGPGRPKGSPNKVHVPVLDRLRALGWDPLDRIVELLPHLSDEKRVDVLGMLMKYCHPQLKASEITKTVDHTLTVTATNVNDLCKLARQGGALPSAPPDGQISILEAEVVAAIPVAPEGTK